MNLTTNAIAKLKLPAGKADHIVFDDAIPGFGIRLRDGGSRKWVYQYKLGAKQRRIVLGDVAAISAGKARTIAGDLHAKVRLGGDPAADKALGKARAANSFGDLVRRYLAFKEGQLRRRSFVEVKRHLEQHAKAMSDLPVTSIDKRTIADRLSRIASDRGDVTANRVRASLSAMFAWAMGEGLTDANPVTNTTKREEKSRDRVLSDAELSTIWNALQDDDYGDILKVLILTAQRLSEIAGLRWPEVHVDRGVIALPSERTKNGRSHEVPMSSAVSTILLRRSRTEDRDLIFGSGERQFAAWTKSKSALGERIVKANGKPLPHWTPHDLRRSAATRMADIGIQPHIIETILNHASGHKGGIHGIYNRASYTREKEQALAIWAEHVAAVVEGRASNVAALRRPA